MPGICVSGDGVGDVLVVSGALSTLHGFGVDGRSRREALVNYHTPDMHFREARKVPKSTPAVDSLCYICGFALHRPSCWG